MILNCILSSTFSTILHPLQSLRNTHKKGKDQMKLTLDCNWCSLHSIVRLRWSSRMGDQSTIRQCRRGIWKMIDVGIIELSSNASPLSPIIATQILIATISRKEECLLRSSVTCYTCSIDTIVFSRWWYVLRFDRINKKCGLAPLVCFTILL